MKLPPLIQSGSELSSNEIHRYSRHILIPEFGINGQQRLKNSRVLVIGAGGLGSPALLYLAAAGVGTLGIVDFDRVEESNLQRQVIHGVDDVGKLKVDSAADSISQVNPYTKVIKHDLRLEPINALKLFSQYDLIVDGTDNFATRYLVNDACVIAEKPYIWGSIFRFEGQASVFWEQAPNGLGINYRDIYPEPPPPELAPSCSEGGVLGILCASIGSIMATEAVKLITGVGESLLGKLMIYDALEMSYRTVALNKAPDRQPITGFVDYQYFCNLNINQKQPNAAVSNISASEVKALIDKGEKLFLIDVREATERDIAKINGAHHVPKKMITSGAGLDDFSKDDPIVVHCKMGGRSRDAAIEMQKLGFKNVKNMQGGILAWIADVEPGLPKY